MSTIVSGNLLLSGDEKQSLGQSILLEELEDPTCSTKEKGLPKRVTIEDLQILVGRARLTSSKLRFRTRDQRFKRVVLTADRLNSSHKYTMKLIALVTH